MSVLCTVYSASDEVLTDVDTEIEDARAFMSWHRAIGLASALIPGTTTVPTININKTSNHIYLGVGIGSFCVENFRTKTRPPYHPYKMAEPEKTTLQTAASPAEQEAVKEEGTLAWLQVLGSFFLNFNTW